MAVPRKVLVLMGSDSDLPVMRKAEDVLKEFEIEYEMHVHSVHRVPEVALKKAADAEAEGFGVIICGAGLAAHLAGAVAGKSNLPVIGVPLESGPLKGLDALLSTVQMPPGIPVATVSVGPAGAKNAALLAIQILARHDGKLAEAYRTFKADQAKSVQAKHQALMERTGR